MPLLTPYRYLAKLEAVLFEQQAAAARRNRLKYDAKWDCPAGQARADTMAQMLKIMPTMAEIVAEAAVDS